MKKIKLIGYSTYMSKNGKKGVEISFIILDEPMKCKDGFSAQGHKVGSASIEYKNQPLYIGSEYDVEIQFGEFNGQQYWRISDITLSKK